MEPVKIREARGLDPDASEDEVKAAFDDAFAVKPEPEPEPVQASLFDDKTPTASTKAAPKKEPVHAAAPGTIVLASSVWEQTQDTIKRLTAYVDKTQRDERDQVIAKAVQ